MTDGLDYMQDPALELLFGEERERLGKARKMTEAERRELLAAVRDILEDEKGRVFMWWLLERTHVFQTSFTGNSTTFFLEGERNIGLQAYALCLEAEPNFMQQLINFKRSKEKTNNDG